MGASISALPARLDLVPGDPANCELTIRNTGTLVDEFTIEVSGEASPWVQVVPPVVQLLPGTEGSVQLQLMPPRTPSPRAGPVPIELRILSKEDPDRSASASATLAVAAFGDLRAELVPRTARERLSATYELTVSNQGNDVVSAAVSARDPDNLLTFKAPPAVTAEPGAEGRAEISVGARKPIVTGRSQPWPFQVVVQDPRWPPVALEGTLIQKPLLPRWLLLLLLVLIVAAAAWIAKGNLRAFIGILVAVGALAAILLRKRLRKPAA